jgi:hypothetical protein
MTEVRVYTHNLESFLFGGLSVRIRGVRLAEDGKIYFAVEGPDVPDVDGVLVARTVTFKNTTLEPVSR